MGGRHLGGVVAAVGAAVTLALAPTAYAGESTSTVRGTGAPLSLVGCASLYERTEEKPRAYLSRTDARLGQRALGYDLAGDIAIGSLHVVESMAETTVASLAVRAPEGATGVSYAGYQEPADAGTDLMWFGRAKITAAADGWTTVDATRLDYTWTKYDTATHEAVGTSPGVTSSVPGFLAEHGDGAGLYTIGFGCDGSRFTMDAVRTGSAGSVTTYDLEGLTSRVSISGSEHVVSAGDAVTIRGDVRSGSGKRIPHATVILEQRALGDSGWRQVSVVAADPGEASVTVRPKESTLYRWRFADRPAHEGSVSVVYAVQVVPEIDGAPGGTPAPSPDPTPDPAPSPSPDPSPDPTPDPSPTPDPTPSESPSPTAVESASASVVP